MKHQLTEQEETQEISLRLEQFDDIFSDFDMRHYSKRALSSDFLEEIKRASRDKVDEAVELILHIPTSERNESREATVKERLGGHFEKHYRRLTKEKRSLLRLGYSMVGLGVIAMIVATMIVHKDLASHFGLSFLIVFLEPAAIFLLWEGMDQVIFGSKTIKPDLDFYRTMADSRSRVHFNSY